MVESVAFGEGRAFEAGFYHYQYIGAVFFHFSQHGACCKTEHAGVPEKSSGCYIFHGNFSRGLFDKLDNRIAVGLNISISGFRRRGLDAECHDLSRSRKCRSLLHGVGEFRLVGNQMICRKNQEDGVRAMSFRNLDRRRRHSRCGIAPKWFENKRKRQLIDIYRPVFVLCLEKKITIGDSQNLRHVVKYGTADERFL